MSVTDDILRQPTARKYVFVPMWPGLLRAHPGAMHPFQHIDMVRYHITDLETTAERHRLGRRARRGTAARSPAPTVPEVEPIPLPFLTAPNWRRPAA